MKKHFPSVLSVLIVFVLFVLAGSAFAVEKIAVAERGVPSDLYLPSGIELTPEFNGDDLGFLWRFKFSSRLAENMDKGFVGFRDGLKSYFYVTYSPLVADAQGKLSANHADLLTAYWDGSKDADLSAWHIAKNHGQIKPWAYIPNGQDNAFRDALNGQTFEAHLNLLPNCRHGLPAGLWTFNLCLEPVDASIGLPYSDFPQIMPRGQGYGNADKLYGELIDHGDYGDNNGVSLAYDATTGYTFCHGGRCWTFPVESFTAGFPVYMWNGTVYPTGGTFYEFKINNVEFMGLAEGFNPVTGQSVTPDPDAKAIWDLVTAKRGEHLDPSGVDYRWSATEGGTDYYYTQFNKGLLAQQRYAMYCKTLPMVIDADGNYVSDKTYELSFTDAGIPAIASQEHGHNTASNAWGPLEYSGVSDPRPFWYYSGMTSTFNPFKSLLDVTEGTAPSIDPVVFAGIPTFDGGGVRSIGADAFYNVCKTLPKPVYDGNSQFNDQGPDALVYGLSVAGSGVIPWATSVTSDFNCDISPNPVTSGTTGEKIVVNVNGFNVAPQIFEGTFGIVFQDFKQMAPRNPNSTESYECLMREGGPCSDYMAFPDAGYVRPKFMR